MYLNKLLFFLSVVLNLTQAAFSQNYAPGVGVAGTSAIHKDSSAFVSWAVSCDVSRGYQDISATSAGLASAGDASLAIGKADGNQVVSLGDGGYAICRFKYPITNGNGPDFAVFENGFDNTFLELSFVEVSSDGINFFRFKAHSLSDTHNQTGPFGLTDPTKINNLAGKYKGDYGTPFDLQELSGKIGLNTQAVTHVKIVDVVGSLNPLYATYDGYGNKVNDPWPTAFGSGGFDLDAVGVINESKTLSLHEQANNGKPLVFPNPLPRRELLRITGIGEKGGVEFYTLDGKMILSSDEKSIDINGIASGMYYVKITSGNDVHFQMVVIE